MLPLWSQVGSGNQVVSISKLPLQLDLPSSLLIIHVQPLPCRKAPRHGNPINTVPRIQTSDGGEALHIRDG